MPRHVGITPVTLAWRCRSPAHPHACGDDADKVDSDVLGNRASPTQVVTTPARRSPLLSPTVHPHACGDDVLAGAVTDHAGGPPPRVWGRRRDRPARRDTSRATPTRVGTTALRRCSTTAATGHPHACGDDGVSGQPGAIRLGPPPRVWGRLVVPADAERHPRATPTRVGTTHLAPGDWEGDKGHPHACGDDHPCGEGLRIDDGPPPRVWGRPFGPCFLNPVNPVNPVFFSSLLFSSPL